MIRAADYAMCVDNVLFAKSAETCCCNKYFIVQILFTKLLFESTVLHRVSKNVPPLACYNFDIRERILIFFWQKYL